jgi:hypothetical protein
MQPVRASAKIYFSSWNQKIYQVNGAPVLFGNILILPKS